MERKGGYNPHTAYIPNGVDYDAFARAVDEPEDLRSIPRPRIGYAGWLKKQLDWRLIDQLVRRHPEWSFVFVGGRKHVAEIEPALDALSGRPNVHFLGHRPVSMLGAYPQHFDVCILPYISNYYTNCIHPMKLHEYLASGRPTVGTPIRSLLPYDHVVALPRSPDEWSRELAHALSPEADAPDLRARRQRIAREHDWSTLTSRIAGMMAQRLGGDVEARFHRLAPAGPVPAVGHPVVEMPEAR
jgi:glycosyltransferase involved in cell wall biosynthesis